ncbi:hypothetical protein B0T16DRAFT_455895 [Cercophora newfieldiana]|uniref:HD domain-containing protein n=1 Tax=Cercophora newfieldiana TaxID=92897 RepID=A0AA39YBF2_9PEZI|nr:hypothetical protein B0T16DRAFT_455895 [Cercophora newfieldiana]
MYNHVMRTWLLGTLMVTNNATLATLVDPEVQAVSLLLHDIGFDQSPNSPIVSPDRRFEVDGAIAAREFIKALASSKQWDDHPLQLVWDSIALHSEARYALFKEPDVATVSTTIHMDFGGPGNGVTRAEYDAVVAAFPKAGLRDAVLEAFMWLCRTKPGVTYDTYVQPFGERFVANYSAAGHQTIDLLLSAPSD